MEFRFDVNELFKHPIVEINSNLIPPGFTAADRRALWDGVSKVAEVINTMGEASAAAQGLTKPITTADRLRNSEHKIYLLIDQSGKNGKGLVTGMLKTGMKGLYMFDRDGHHYQVKPPCILDFYVHESRQRTGLGRQLFEHMLEKEKIEPVKLAIDRPSEKFLGFLNKHYALNNAIKQMNNYVVFDGFFPEPLAKVEVAENNNTSPLKMKESFNGLQSAASSYGRYAAPRPPCSMGQIIHNQSPLAQQPQEPTGNSLNIRPVTKAKSVCAKRTSKLSVDKNNNNAPKARDQQFYNPHATQTEIHGFPKTRGNTQTNLAQNAQYAQSPNQPEQLYPSGGYEGAQAPPHHVPSQHVQHPQVSQTQFHNQTTRTQMSQPPQPQEYLPVQSQHVLGPQNARASATYQAYSPQQISNAHYQQLPYQPGQIHPLNAPQHSVENVQYVQYEPHAQNTPYNQRAVPDQNAQRYVSNHAGDAAVPQQYQPVQQHQPIQHHQPTQQYQPTQQHQLLQRGQPTQQYQPTQQHQPSQQRQPTQQYQTIQQQPVEQLQPSQQHQPVRQYQPPQPPIQQYEPTQQYQPSPQYQPVQQYQPTQQQHYQTTQPYQTTQQYQTTQPYQPDHPTRSMYSLEPQRKKSVQFAPVEHAQGAYDQPEQAQQSGQYVQRRETGDYQTYAEAQSTTAVDAQRPYAASPESGDVDGQMAPQPTAKSYQYFDSNAQRTHGEVDVQARQEGDKPNASGDMQPMEERAEA